MLTRRQFVVGGAALGAATVVGGAGSLALWNSRHNHKTPLWRGTVLEAPIGWFWRGRWPRTRTTHSRGAFGSRTIQSS